MILDLNKVGDYLDNIAYGFNATILDLVLILAGLLLFIAILTTVYLFRRRRKMRAYREQSAKLFEKYASKAGLEQEERDVAEQLSKIVSPDGKRKHIILESQSAFNNAASKLELAEERREILHSLRLKLDFRDHAERNVNSTIELGRGQHLYIVPAKNEKPLHGRIKQQTPEGIVVELREKERTVRKEAFVRVYFHRGSGVYGFSASVLEASAGEIELAHSEYISKVQRRNYYRRQLNLPVEVWKPGVDREVKNYGRSFDLGGGGASVDFHSHKEDFKEGDRFMLNLHLPDNEKLTLPGTVVRLSKKGKRVHFEFDAIREGQRDKIMKHVFQGGSMLS